MRMSLSRLGILLSATAMALVAAAGSAAADPAPTTTRDGKVLGGAAIAKTEKAQSPVRSTESGFSTQAEFNGYCETWELCVFRLNAFEGSMVDYFTADPNYGDNTYFMWGPGFGEPLANNSQSAYNADPFYWAIVCTDRFYSGQCGYVPPGGGGDFFPDWFLNVESSYFLI